MQIRNLCKSFDGSQYLKNVSFDLEQGETIGIIGNNASSKTLLIKSVSGVISPEEGTVQILEDTGKCQQIKKPADARNAGIIVLHEDIMLYDHFYRSRKHFFSVHTIPYLKLSIEKKCMLTRRNYAKNMISKLMCIKT